MSTPPAGPPEQPIINIQGDLVALGPYRRDLLPLYTRWINDLPAARNLGAMPRPMTADQEEEWFNGVLKDQHAVAFTIYERQTWRPIGNAGLHQISLSHRCAVFGIFIGEPEARGKGYGTETTKLVLDYAFTVLNLHSVSLITDEHNIAGQRAYRKAGFREFGRQRQGHLVGGVFQDVVHMDCLASEFTSPVLARLFAPEVPRP